MPVKRTSSFLLLLLLCVKPANAQEGATQEVATQQAKVPFATYQIYIPLVSALAGALVGASASVLTIWLQSRSQERRDRLKLITDLAIADQKTALEFSKSHEGEIIVPPLASYVSYHRAILEIVANREL